MAQLSGVMTADFSDFHFEIDKSVTKLKEMEGASTHTSGAIDEFSDGLGQADKTLNVLGIRMGPQIQALRELGSAAGKTASEIGLIGTAGLTVAAAMGGWQIGRWVADLVGFDDAIANATSSLLGFGDAGLEATRAKIDLFARASNIAGREIRDVATAMDIIKKENARVAESFNTGTERVRQWNAEIAAHKGDLPTITAELKNHSSTVQQLATHYGISKEAIEHYMRTLDASTKAQKAWADEARPRYEAIRKAQEELNQTGDGWRKTLETIAPVTAAAVTQYLAMGQSQTTLATAYSLSTVQVRALEKAYQEQIATLARLEPPTQSLDTWMRTVGQQFQVAAESGDQFKTMLELTGGAATELAPALEKLETRFHSLTTAMAAPSGAQMGTSHGNTPINLGEVVFPMGMEAALANYTARYGTSSSAGLMGGGSNLPDFITWAKSMGLAQSGTTVQNTFNIVDTESGIARRIGDTITGQIQQGSLVN